MPYLTAAQIEAEMTALVAPGLCSKISLPNATVSEGIGPTTYSYLKIGRGGGASRVTVLAVAGMHAREWAQPDAVISFAKKLLSASQANAPFVIPAYTDAAGNTFGPNPVPAATVKRMVEELDILLVPCANPDGRAHSQSTTANRWRKNRAPRLVAADPATVGVDLNRNFDIAWDFQIFYDAAFAASSSLSASKDPADDRFIGKPQSAPNAAHPASEPEARNLVWILDNHPVTYSIDLHSYLMVLVHPWAIEENGTAPAQNFRNAGFNGARDGTLGTAYREFFPDDPPVRLLARHRLVVGDMRDAVRAATGRVYSTGGIADIIYPATGSFTDYHFSRQFTVPGSPPIHAFAAEFGDSADNFQPLYNDPHGFPKIEREVHAALISLLKAALPAPGTSGGGGGGGGGACCLFWLAAVDLADGAARLETLRRGRAALLRRRGTRRATLALDSSYRRLSSRVVPRLVDKPWARQVVARVLLVPASTIIAGVLKVWKR